MQAQEIEAYLADLGQELQEDMHKAINSKAVAGVIKHEDMPEILDSVVALSTIMRRLRAVRAKSASYKLRSEGHDQAQ
jgi:hypothetical protein